MKKSVKIIMVIMSILAILLMFSISSFALIDPSTDIDIKDEIGQSTELLDMAGRVMGIIRNIAVIAGVIVLMVIGVKFIMGSAEEKAEYKKSLVPLVVGIILVMAATTIVSFLFTFMGGTK